MDARESMARALLRSEVDVYSEDPWEEAGEEMHAAYLHDADAIIVGVAKLLWRRGRRHWESGRPAAHVEC